MNRTRTTLWLATVALSVLLPACSNKARESPPSIPQPSVRPVTPTVDVRPSATGAASDTAAGAMPRDIKELNDWAMKNGFLGDVYFEFDRADLTEDSRGRLAKNSDWLRSNPVLQVTIEGHCDERGTNDYNLALGQRRAAAAQDYVTSLGVTGGRISAQSWGEERPQCNESSEGCWARNRRAHFVITARIGG